MKQEYENELTPEVREKMKMNLVYVGILSVIMLFGGLTSAYIVSMGDSFWLKFPLPTPFFISTVLIVLSSITFVAAVFFAKRNNQAMLKAFMLITFVLGLGFVFFQFKGYGKLIDDGVYVRGNILVNEGRYDDYYNLKYNGNYLEVDGNHYYLAGKDATVNEKKEIGDFAAQLVNADTKDGLKNLKNYGSKFTISYKNDPLTYLNDSLVKSNGEALKSHDLYRLKFFATHLKDGRGDFYAKGEFGKDFKIYFKNTELSYKDRSLYKGNQKLSPYLQNSAMDAADSASSYLYILTFMHLLHIIVTLIFLVKTVTYSFKGKYSSEDTIGLRVTGIFWHFLGLLWLFLLLFLLFIH